VKLVVIVCPLAFYLIPFIYSVYCIYSVNNENSTTNYTLLNKRDNTRLMAMKRTAPSSPTHSPPSKIPATTDPCNTVLRICELPEEVLGIISACLDQDELEDLRLTSKQFYNTSEKCFKELCRAMWKSDINFSPLNGSWCAQFSHWDYDFSQLKHSLPKVTWCVEHGADRKLLSLLHVPPPFRKRMLRLLNAPTVLRLEDSPLHYACAMGCIDVIHVILSYPNGLESVNKLIKGECRGVAALWAPLHYAISYGHPEVVKLLLENGAHADLAERGVVKIPFFAQLCGNQEIVNILADV